jgi:hypothetical protein
MSRESGITEGIIEETPPFAVVSSRLNPVSQSHSEHDSTDDDASESSFNSDHTVSGVRKGVDADDYQGSVDGVVVSQTSLNSSRLSDSTKIKLNDLLDQSMQIAEGVLDDHHYQVDASLEVVATSDDEQSVAKAPSDETSFVEGIIGSMNTSERDEQDVDHSANTDIQLKHLKTELEALREENKRFLKIIEERKRQDNRDDLDEEDIVAVASNHDQAGTVLLDSSMDAFLQKLAIKSLRQQQALCISKKEELDGQLKIINKSIDQVGSACSIERVEKIFDDLYQKNQKSHTQFVETIRTLPQLVNEQRQLVEDRGKLKKRQQQVSKFIDDQKLFQAAIENLLAILNRYDAHLGLASDSDTNVDMGDEQVVTLAQKKAYVEDLKAILNPRNFQKTDKQLKGEKEVTVLVNRLHEFDTKLAAVRGKLSTSRDHTRHFLGAIAVVFAPLYILLGLVSKATPSRNSFGIFASHGEKTTGRAQEILNIVQPTLKGYSNIR